MCSSDLGTLRERKDWDGDCDVLKVAHHGSKYSSTKAFLQSLDPKLAVISCGANNRYGHPHAETLERLEEQGVQWVRTDEKGAVVIEVEDNKITIFKFK